MPDIQTVFIAYGAAIRSGIRIPPISNLRVAPTIARILGIDLPHAQEALLAEILRAP